MTPGNRPEGGFVKRKLPPLLSSLALYTVAAGLLAQAYGPLSQLKVLPASAFRARSTSDGFTSNGAVLTPTADNFTRFVAPVELPNGAVLEQAVIFITSNDPFNSTNAALMTYGFGTSTATTCGPDTVWSGSLPVSSGVSRLTLTGAAQFLLPKSFCGQEESFLTYYLEVTLPSTFTSLSGAVLVWHRTMTSAPVGASFNDVPEGHPFFRAIEALSASGITSGCGGGNFCPNDVVTRDQMAKFLAVALGLHFGASGGFSP
jgi:hypothetical protein